MLERGTKLYLDQEETEESSINRFLACRDGVVERYEYRSMSGYGEKIRLYLCRDTKHESVAVIRAWYDNMAKRWYEQEMDFDSDSFVFLEALIKGKQDEFGGKFEVLRDYSLG